MGDTHPTTSSHTARTGGRARDTRQHTRQLDAELRDARRRLRLGCIAAAVIAAAAVYASGNVFYTLQIDGKTVELPDSSTVTVPSTTIDVDMWDLVNQEPRQPVAGMPSTSGAAPSSWGGIPPPVLTTVLSVVTLAVCALARLTLPGIVSIFLSALTLRKLAALRAVVEDPATGGTLLTPQPAISTFTLAAGLLICVAVSLTIQVALVNVKVRARARAADRAAGRTPRGSLMAGLWTLASFQLARISQLGATDPHREPNLEAAGETTRKRS